MEKLPRYEKAIQHYEQLIEGVPHRQFATTAQAVLVMIRKKRPPTTMLALHLMTLAYRQLLGQNAEIARMLLLAALSVCCEETRASLVRWSMQELASFIKAAQAKSEPSHLPPLPQVQGVPSFIMDALNQVIAKTDINALPEGASVLNTAIGKMQIVKLKSPISDQGDPRLN